MHNQIARQEAGEDQPCADLTLLAPLKRSAEYRLIHPRLADIRPLDHWQQDSLHYFVFPLKMADGSVAAIDDAPVAVFTMHPEATAPVSVVVVTPSPDGGAAEVVSVRNPEASYSTPLPPQAGAVTISAGGDAVAVDQHADMPRPIDEGRETDGELPLADPATLRSLKISREYQTLQPRLADGAPIDSWRDEGLHYFVFELQTEGEGGGALAEEAPVAVFAMRPELPEPVSVVVVTPGLDGGQPTVLALRQPQSGNTVPLSSGNEPAALAAG